MQEKISHQKLPPSFYLQDTVEVAKQLIGKLLVRKMDGQTLSAIICETEAYTGFSDKACHSYKGKSERTQVMFEQGGRAYVYLIYGMYNCFNITTREEGVPEAVLIRAACPVEGIEQMTALRQRKKQIKSLNEKNLLSGPGRLCDGMGITREQTVCCSPERNCISVKESSCLSSRLRRPSGSISTMQRKQRTFCTALWIPKVPACRSNGGKKDNDGGVFLR